MKNLKFKTIRDVHKPLKYYVWYRKFCLGYYESELIENKNIDWGKYRRDKSLKMQEKRYKILYHAVCFPKKQLGSFRSDSDAAYAILKHHEDSYNSYEKFNEVIYERQENKSMEPVDP